MLVSLQPENISRVRGQAGSTPLQKALTQWQWHFSHWGSPCGPASGVLNKECTGPKTLYSHALWGPSGYTWEGCGTLCISSAGGTGSSVLEQVRGWQAGVWSARSEPRCSEWEGVCCQDRQRCSCQRNNSPPWTAQPSAPYRKSSSILILQDHRRIWGPPLTEPSLRGNAWLNFIFCFSYGPDSKVYSQIICGQF